MWIAHPSFMDLVCTIWSTPFQGSLMGVVIRKLKGLKSTLKGQNREIFGNLDRNVERESTTLIEIQKWYDDDFFSEELLHFEFDAHTNFDRSLHQLDIFLLLAIEDQTKVAKGWQWKYYIFHQLLQYLKVQKPLDQLDINGKVTHALKTIDTYILGYYEQLFSAQLCDPFDSILIKLFVPFWSLLWIMTIYGAYHHQRRFVLWFFTWTLLVLLAQMGLWVNSSNSVGISLVYM